MTSHAHIVLIERHNPPAASIPGCGDGSLIAHRPDPVPAEVPPMPPQEVPAPPPPGYLPDPQPTPAPAPQQPSRPVDASPSAGGTFLVLTRRWD